MKKYFDRAPVVSMRNITKRFFDKEVLTKIDFDLHKCEVHALLGENGAGKTTLMNILYGMFPPSEGSVTINDTQKGYRSRYRYGSPTLYAN